MVKVLAIPRQIVELLFGKGVVYLEEG